MSYLMVSHRFSQRSRLQLAGAQGYARGRQGTASGAGPAGDCGTCQGGFAAGLGTGLVMSDCCGEPEKMEKNRYDQTQSH